MTDTIVGMIMCDLELTRNGYQHTQRQHAHDVVTAGYSGTLNTCVTTTFFCHAAHLIIIK